MIRLLPTAIALALAIFCLIDCIQSDEHRIRNLPKWAWFVLIILIPIAGPVVWLLAGRPTRASAGGDVTWPTTRTAGFPQYERPRQRAKAPDDDPEFLRSLKKANTEHEDMLRKWEEDLKKREEEMRKDEEPKPDES
ncbi:MAG TPA: PLD nuclease N-terminal domain-containing protein [Propionicimonas sp.]|nr:PLD nuclease N-terminal domain-containing protein [Propionicimonas sp.]